MGENKILRRIILIAALSPLAIIFISLLVPLLIDVERYKNDFLYEINKTIPGHLALGEMRLSALGVVQFRINEVVLKESKEIGAATLFQSPLVYGHVSLASLLLGDPRLTITLERPLFFIRKDQNMQFNFLKALDPRTRLARGISENIRKTDIMNLLLSAKFNVKIKSGFVIYEDTIRGDMKKMNDIFLNVENFGFNSFFTYSLESSMFLSKNFSDTVWIQGTIYPRFFLLNTHFFLEGIELLDTSIVFKKSRIQLDDLPLFFSQEMNGAKIKIGGKKILISKFFLDEQFLRKIF